MKKIILTLSLAAFITLGTAFTYSAVADNSTISLVKIDKDKEEVKKEKKKNNITVQDVKNNPDEENSNSESNSDSFNNDELIHEGSVVEGDCTKSGYDKE